MQEKKKWENRIPLLASFLIPLLIALIVCIDHEVFPFGDRCILHVDMYHQYCPFFTEFMNKLKEINDNNSTSYKYGERSCGLVVSHTNANAVEYCKNCCAWICEKCAKAHSKYISFTKHKRMKYKIDMY